MRVLVISNMYPTQCNPIGGIFVHEQVKALRRRGLDARVASGRPLWLAGTHPVQTLRTIRNEFRSRKQPLLWDDYDGVPVTRFNYFAGAFARPRFYPSLYAEALRAILGQLTEEFPYELVHTHTAFLDGRAGAAAARLRKAPLVLTEHTGPFQSVTKPGGFRSHTLFGLKSADHVIAVSRALREQIKAELPELSTAIIDVVPNGVDTRFFSAEAIASDKAAREESARGRDDSATWVEAIEKSKTKLVLSSFLIGLREALKEVGDTPIDIETFCKCLEEAVITGNGEGRYRHLLKQAGLPFEPFETDGVPTLYEEASINSIKCLWVGHFVDVKGVDRLLEAFAIASKRRPELQLRLVGHGPLEKAMRAKARELDIRNKVTFAGALDREGVRKEMANASFLAISSHTETFAVVGIEAMAMGLPVLSTACGGPSDYVISAGHGEIVGNTTEDLAIGLQRMAERAAFVDRESIRRHAVESYDFDLIVDRLVEIYKCLILGKKPIAPPQKSASADTSHLDMNVAI